MNIPNSVVVLNSGLSVVANGGGHGISVTNNGSVTSDAIFVPSLPTFAITGDGGLISYSGTGSVSRNLNETSGLAISNTGSGGVQMGSAANPMPAFFSGGGTGTNAPLSITTVDGSQNLFFNGGILNTNSGNAVRLNATGSGDINLQITGDVPARGTLNVTSSTGKVTIRSEAKIGTESQGIFARSANDVSVTLTGGSIVAREAGISANTFPGTGNIAVNVQAGSTITTTGFAGFGNGINTNGGSGSQNISVGGTIDAAVNGIALTGGAGALDITVSGNVKAVATGVVAFGGPVNITNSGTITGRTGIASNFATVHNSGTISGTGGTAVQFGGSGNVMALQAGSNITGNVVGTGADTLQLEGAANATLDVGAIGAAQQYRGFSTLAKTGSSVWTLQGTGSFSGATSVNAGTLNVTGKIASSAFSVANGATLTGTGTVGATTVASGGTLIPGASGAPGILAVSGNLTLGSGANFVDFITPTSAGLVTASGTASVNGNAVANFASGSYAMGQRFTLITATGGVSGAFVSLSTLGIPISLRGRLSYDANNVYLNLDPNALTPLLANATGNQSKVAKAIDTALAEGASLPAGFQTLFNLSGPALNSALDQLSGPIGPNIINSVGQSFQGFLSLTAQGGDGGSNFAPGSAYGSAAAPHRAQLGAGEARVWGAAYGGHIGLSADPVSGAASLSGTNAGLVGGVDMRVADGLLLGATFGWGGQDFRSGNGTGTSDDIALGLYARHESGPLYVSAVLGFGWHDIKTLRTVTVSGTDVLQGVQNVTDVGGRLEAGWHLALDETYRVTPYAAFMGQGLDSPGYAETAVSGASTFALSVARHTDALGRMEMGTRLGRDYALGDGTLAADLQIAWAHQINDVPLTQATFLGLPGSSFAVAGVQSARDAALLGGALEVRKSSGFFFGVRGETLLGDGTMSVEGMGSLGWLW